MSLDVPPGLDNEWHQILRRDLVASVCCTKRDDPSPPSQDLQKRAECGGART